MLKYGLAGGNERLELLETGNLMHEQGQDKEQGFRGHKWSQI